MDNYGNLVIGETYSLYGVHDRCFKLGNTVFEAIEDPDDGYRSYLKSVEIVDKEIKDKLVFSNKPFVNVTLVDATEICGINFIDESEHCWLSIGTDVSDSYYPFLYFIITLTKT